MTALTDLTDCVVNYTDENMFLGQGDGGSLSGGEADTALGANALQSVTGGSNNVAVGANSLAAITGSGNNTAVGSGAIQYADGEQNTAVGYAALGGGNASGDNNVAIGFVALQLNTGDNNTAVGWSAGDSLASGDGNVFIGYLAADQLASGSDNILIGRQAGNQALTSGSGNILIGAQVAIPSPSSNYLNIGDAITGPLSGPALVNGFTAATQSLNDNSMKVATTAYVDRAATDANITFTDVTTNNVSSTKHGFAPKSPADATKFLNGATTPAYAQVKDSDLSTSDITTNNSSSTKHGFAPKSPADATKFLNGDTTPAYAQVKDSDLSTSDVTTNNASTSKHGFLKKLDNDATHYMDGTGNWSTPAAGALTLIASATASSSSTIDFTSGIDSTYDEYILELVDLIPATNAVDLWIRASTDGGSTWKSGASDYAYTGTQSRSGANTGDGSNTAAQIAVIAQTNHWSNGASQSISGQIRFYNPANSSSKKRMMISLSGMDANSPTPTLISWTGVGSYIGGTTALNGVRFLMSSGNISSGKFHLYGVQK